MSKIVAVLIIIIILILGVIGGIYYYSTLPSPVDVSNVNNVQADVNQNLNNQNNQEQETVPEKVLVQTKIFSVMLPETWIFEEKQGIDSYVGEFRGDGLTLFFDYGWYSGDPSRGDNSYTTTRKNINGFEAKIFESSVNNDLGIYFNNLPDNNRLTIYGRRLDATQRQLVLEIFDSINFSRPEVLNAFQVCRNLAYGYELTYPAHWKIWTAASPEGKIISCSENLMSLTFAESDQTFSSVLPYITITVFDSDARLGTAYAEINSLDDYVQAQPLEAELRRSNVNGYDLVFEKNTMISFNDDLLFVVKHNLKEEEIFSSIDNFKFVEVADIVNRETISENQRQLAAKILADVKQIHTALELFYNDNDFYPANLPGGTKLGVDVKQLGKEGFNNTNFLYMGVVPADPRTPEHDYFYSNCSDDFVIRFHLDIDYDNVSSGVNYYSKEGISADLSSNLIDCTN